MKSSSSVYLKLLLCLVTFFIDQGAASLVGGDTDLLRSQAVAMIRAGVLSGEFYVAQTSTGDVAGFTLWMPPGQEMFAT